MDTGTLAQAAPVQQPDMAVYNKPMKPAEATRRAARCSRPRPPRSRSGSTASWDYRFCWLRDAAFTARCLYGLGYGAEAEAWVYWLMHTTRLTQPRLAVLYDVFGSSPGKETVLEHLGGYGGSRPVRIGNGAEQQLQLDIHGELIDAVCLYAGEGGQLDRESRTMVWSWARGRCNALHPE